MDLIKSALHNLSSSENTSRDGIDDYCHGLVVGIVSSLMDRGMTFYDAIDHIKARLPHDLDKDRFPSIYQGHLD